MIYPDRTVDILNLNKEALDLMSKGEHEKACTVFIELSEMLSDWYLSRIRRVE